jgi:hypothetical protein
LTCRDCIQRHSQSAKRHNLKNKLWGS